MLRRIVVSFVLLVLLFACDVSAQPPERPKLVVVIALDQFPFEYLVRFGRWFGPGGFRRLMTEGAVFTHASFGHSLLLTGPGHAAIMSGTYGHVNGIIANTWYDRARHAPVYCVDDPSAPLVGTTGAGKSPWRFIGTSYGDELRLATGFRAKVITVSDKDRAAVLTGGKLANGAYWMSDSLFVTSSYYMAALPPWAREFNAGGSVNAYFGRTWNLRLPPAALQEADEDDVVYEDGGNGLGRTFPHRITGTDPKRITPSFYTALIESPFGNEVLVSFAKAAMRAEQLGKRGVTDLLVVSFSATDYVGHAFGPHSREVMDLAVAADSAIADLLRFLDTELGAGTYVAALSSDHGVAPIPEYILRHHPGADAGRVPSDSIAARCESALRSRWGVPANGLRWIEKVVNGNIYLRGAVLQEFHTDPQPAARVAAEALMRLGGIAAAYPREDLEAAAGLRPLLENMQRSYHPLRSGDLMYALKPEYLEGTERMGTSHGQPYEYDQHVPLIIMGPGIKPGSYAGRVSPIDLAPTLSVLTGTEFPAQCEGRVLTEALK
jgi:predicted AlkP superfamily pyrophosphatase or phosphodiesterase